MRRSIVTLLPALVLGLVVSAAALLPGNAAGTTHSAALLTPDNSSRIDANRILMFVTNHGDFGRDIDNTLGRNAGTYFPFVTMDDILSGLSDNTVLSAAGLCIGGRVGGQTRVAISEYTDEYVPGPMEGGIYQIDRPAYRVYKLYRDSLAENPNADYLNWPADQGAPVDAAGQPLMRGEQMLWTVYNDADPAQHNDSLGSTQPLGIEVQQTIWAESPPDGTDTIIFADTTMAEHVAGTGVGSVATLVVLSTAEIGRQYYVTFSDSLGGLRWRITDVNSGVTTWPGSSLSLLDGVYFFLTYVTPLGVHQIIETSNADGPLSPPQDVKYEVNSTGDWYVSSDQGDDFDRMNWQGLIGSSSWELRFTDSGSVYYNWNSDNLMPNRIPFEAWNIGDNTPDDSSDDVRINITYMDDDGSGGWSYGDRIYLVETPYVEPAPSVMQYAFPDDFRIGRIVFRAAASGSPLPEAGTTVRITSNEVVPLSPADTFLVTVPPYRSVPLGGDNSAVYMTYKLFNRGANAIDSCYVGLWADPDVGGPTDDLVGCDTLNDLFYSYQYYNDAEYGQWPPAVGFKVVDGPLVAGEASDTATFDGHPVPGYRNLGLTGFSRFVDGADPANADEMYRFMQGLTADGQLLPNGTHYAVPGYPLNAPSGDIDSNPGDRRMMGSVGPFTFNPGDSQFVMIKMGVGKGFYNWASLTRLWGILNTPAPPEVYMTLKSDPDPLPSYWINAGDSTSAAVSFGYSSAGAAGTGIDWATLVFDGLPTADSVKVLDSLPGFQGNVLRYYFDPHDLIASLGSVWDTTRYLVHVSGRYTTDLPFNAVGVIPVTGQISGDVNSDGVVNLSDVYAELDILFGGGAMPPDPRVVDIDGSCQFSISDVTYLVGSLFLDFGPPHHCGD